MNLSPRRTKRCSNGQPARVAHPLFLKLPDVHQELAERHAVALKCNLDTADTWLMKQCPQIVAANFLTFLCMSGIFLFRSVLQTSNMSNHDRQSDPIGDIRSQTNVSFVLATSRMKSSYLPILPAAGRYATGSLLRPRAAPWDHHPSGEDVMSCQFRILVT